MPAWLLPAVVGAVGAISTALGVRESRKNREFQERMSNTAHQREVDDLRKAGLHPMLSAGGGASQPQGNVADFKGLDEAVVNALAVKQMQANVELTKANTEKTRSEAKYLDESFQLRLREQGARTDVGELSAQQARDLLPLAKRKAEAEISQMLSGARQLKAQAALHELDRARAMNAQELEKWLKGGSPGVRLFLEVLRGIRR